MATQAEYQVTEGEFQYIHQISLCIAGTNCTIQDKEMTCLVPLSRTTWEKAESPGLTSAQASSPPGPTSPLNSGPKNYTGSKARFILPQKRSLGKQLAAAQPMGRCEWFLNTEHDRLVCQVGCSRPIHKPRRCHSQIHVLV